MFNSFSSNQNIKINAVSGTIVKNYRNSFFVRFHLRSSAAETVFSVNPEYRRRPVVVLQVMLCGNDELIAELMWKDKFNDLFERGEKDNV